MKKLALGLGALLLSMSAASAVHAQHYQAPPPPPAPDACGPGWYNTHPAGMTYGPNHWLQPPWMPFNGLVPPVGRNGGPPSIYNFQGNGNGGPQGSPMFATHPYARSPRDYFMLD